MGKNHGDHFDDVLYLAREQQLYRWATLRGSLNTTKNNDKKRAESRSRVTKERGLESSPVVFVVFGSFSSFPSTRTFFLFYF